MNEKELVGRLPLFPLTRYGKKLTKEQLLLLIKLIEGSENAPKHSFLLNQPIELIYPKRGKCACGGYFQDWHSHASECIVINHHGKDFGNINITE
jgi:hypothetical protein